LDDRGLKVLLDNYKYHARMTEVEDEAMKVDASPSQAAPRGLLGLD
jgi:hypothetical protein